MSKMSDRRKDLRPREKLAHKGPAALSDYELLMAIIGSGNAQADVTKIARELLKVLRNTVAPPEGIDCFVVFDGNECRLRHSCP